MNWQSIATNPNYIAKPEHEKRLIRDDYFQTFLVADPDFLKLPDMDKQRVVDEFVVQDMPIIE